MYSKFQIAVSRNCRLKYWSDCTCTLKPGQKLHCLSQIDKDTIWNGAACMAYLLHFFQYYSPPSSFNTAVISKHVIQYFLLCKFSTCHVKMSAPIFWVYLALQQTTILRYLFQVFKKKIGIIFQAPGDTHEIESLFFILKSSKFEIVVCCKL